jgi:hypothetical protein
VSLPPRHLSSGKSQERPLSIDFTMSSDPAFRVSGHGRITGVGQGALGTNTLLPFTRHPLTGFCIRVTLPQTTAPRLSPKTSRWPSIRRSVYVAELFRSDVSRIEGGGIALVLPAAPASAVEIHANMPAATTNALTEGSPGSVVVARIR